MKMWIKYLVMFMTLVLLQVLVLNQVHLGGFLNPYIYILFILLLPVSMPRYQVLLLAFLTGILIDWFSNTLGLHASATVLMAYLRQPVIKLITQGDSEQSDYPGIKQSGFRFFLLYCIILVIIHHFFLFFTEVFTFDNFLLTLLRSILSSVLTIIVIILSQFLVFRD